MKSVKEFETVECSKCGFLNVLGSKTCAKCHTPLKNTTKSCPKCAKRNKLDVKKCVSCGYVFGKKSHSLLINLIITSVFVLTVLAIVYFNENLEKKHINILIYIVGGIGILSVFISTLTYGKSEKLILVAEEEINKRTFKNSKRFIRIILYIVFILFIILLGYVLYTIFM